MPHLLKASNAKLTAKAAKHMTQMLAAALGEPVCCFSLLPRSLFVRLVQQHFVVQCSSIHDAACCVTHRAVLWGAVWHAQVGTR